MVPTGLPKNLEKLGVREILKKPGILNNFYMLSSKILIWHDISII